MNIQPSKRISQVSEYYFSTKLREIREMTDRGIPVINLGIGNPDLGTHPSVLSELRKASYREGQHHYQPYKGIDILRVAFAEWYQKTYHVQLDPQKQILPLMGSKEGILHISMAFTDPGDLVLVPNPGYPTYGSVSRMLGLEVKQYDLYPGNDWLPEIEQLEKLCTEKCRIIWINYPHMPSGTRADDETFQRLIEFALRKNVLLVNDNPYSLVDNEDPKSILSFANKQSHVLELNSLSKSHNMAGWRVGCVVGAPENIENILKVKSNFDSGMYKPIQEASVKALQLPVDWYEAQNAAYSSRRRIVHRICDHLGCGYNLSATGLFVWAHIPLSFTDGQAFSDYLLYQKSIFAAPGFIFGSNGNDFIRFSLCQPEQVLLEVEARIRKPLKKAI